MTIKSATIKSAKSLWNSFPLILGTILLVSLISTIIPKSFYSNIFSKNIVLDSIIGSLIGSISAGNPITSYIFGGELLKQGISLVAVTAFLVAWVTVGVVQLPAESAILGKRFAFLRNFTSFILAILVAIMTVLTLGVLAWI
ncbi:MAG: permease [Methanocellales archaeon]|nr:permease [Methanocellales archaeon]MDD3292413.1 permease [Methanocellales archaeon]MDD5235999.1 permease [Methanocellales archaeon]MDD5485895.1 permease [Methanocellales archaeon]